MRCAGRRHGCPAQRRRFSVGASRTWVLPTLSIQLAYLFDYYFKASPRGFSRFAFRYSFDLAERIPSPALVLGLSISHSDLSDHSAERFPLSEFCLVDRMMPVFIAVALLLWIVIGGIVAIVVCPLLKEPADRPTAPREQPMSEQPAARLRAQL